MAKSNGLLLKWGFLLFLLLGVLPLAVWGAEPQTVVESKLIDNMEYYEADLRDVFRSLGEYGAVNVLMDKEVRGTATIRFNSGITAKEAFEVLAKTNGYTCYWLLSQNTVVIGNEATYQKLDTLYTKVYSLKYADPEAVADTLKVIVPKEQLGIDKRANQLAVKGNLLQQENVVAVLKDLDREMPQISIEMRIEETTHSALDQLGVGWTSDALSLDLDSPKFTHISKVNLNLWEERTNSKMLARPMISTTDSKEASIFIGDKVPVTEKSVDEKAITYTVKYIDVGTKLVVTPRINAENIVTVNVKAILSNITGSTPIGAGNEKYDVPNVRNREVGSVIRLRDGETFMLSGLNQNESSFIKNGLKGFQKIPLIGKLFQSTTKKDPGNETEIVIFITPRIIRTDTAGNQPEETSQKAENTAVGSSTLGGTAKQAIPPAVAPAAPVTPAVPAQSAPIRTAKTQPEDVPEQPSPITAAKAQPEDIPTQLVDVSAQPASIEEINPQPVQPQPVVTTPLAAQPQPSTSGLDGQRHMVQLKPGQTVSQIAALYGVSSESILKDNGLTAADPVFVGQELFVTIPADHLYCLEPKETMWRIAKRYGIPLPILQEINQLPDVTKVQAGQTIILPVPVRAVMAQDF
jgi:type II secretory pathway component GspD/PulD (secretin)